jgi:uncharacterized protein DUF3891
MLHRDEPDGLVVISQPAHAWVAAQLARAWGNARFGEVTPREEVCLGAEQHDIGWTAWEGAPTLNPATGRPHAFTQMALATHLAIWSSAGALALRQGGRYAALLVSMHGTHLYGGRDGSRDTPAEAQAVRDFLARERAWQATILASLRDDPRYAAGIPDGVARNQRLVSVWDRLSLALCMGLRAERAVEGVPTVDGATTLTLTPIDGSPSLASVHPWPFGAPAVTLLCEGRRLPETFADEATMRTTLDRSPWVTIATTLRPAERTSTGG